MRSKRERATDYRRTYMVTTQTRNFRAESWVRRFIGTLDYDRDADCLLYEFVVMPDHILPFIRPLTSLDRAVPHIQDLEGSKAHNGVGYSLAVPEGAPFSSPPRTSASESFPLANQGHQQTKSGAA